MPLVCLTGGAEGPDSPSVQRDQRIGRLLVANRGELVVRIARTCQALGIRCLALVAEDQAQAWWADQLDERVPLSGTYLDAEAVLQAARDTRADAIHPGYGFLAENADFADAVAAAGIGWVGPPGAAMRALGDKASGRRLAASIGVPVLPGYDGAKQTDEALVAEAERIGFPVLVKPSAGGGGKGMHVVRSAAELPESLGTARREAQTAFGDERLILERFLESPRHVEVQLLVDQGGHAVHLGERDCSLQRRHQKVIEESPSPAVDEELRDRLGEAAIALAKAAGYVGAGTAEFLLDDIGSFHFLEVNARLQVEHPVTELVTGRDLVADQLRIAAGEAIGFAQSDVRLDGHAIEARIYAEDPWDGFLPATGVVTALAWPEAPGIRVDAGVGQWDEIGTRYDPLLAKVLARGASRDEALDRLTEALEATRLEGVTTNRGFLARLLRRREVRSGEARVDTIEQVWEGTDEPELTRRALAAGSAALAGAAIESLVATGFRLNAPHSMPVEIGPSEPGTPQTRVDVEGRSFTVRLVPAPTVEAAIRHSDAASGAASTVTAPMPGQVLAIRVEHGARVEAGQTLLLLEAMKMENAVTAPADSTVARVLVQAGQQVQRGDALIELT